MTSQQLALAKLGRLLKASGYRFVTITPDSHGRMVRRHPDWTAQNVRDVFGWNRPFDKTLLNSEWFALLESAGALDIERRLFRSKVRFSTLGSDLFMHSAYPTDEQDSVFFGPDTYRFARLIKATLLGRKAATSTIPAIVDVGAGSGAGGIVAWRTLGCSGKLVLADISPKALDFARVNALMADCDDGMFCQSDLFAEIDDADIILSNPPYLLDANARVYRHGGGTLGSALSTRIVAEGIPKLKPGGLMILYTGSVIVDGKDGFLDSVTPILSESNVTYSYEELDSDVFGEELDSPAYGKAERVAAVGLVVHKMREESHYW